MTKTDTPRPTEAELAILQVLWRLGSATVRQVHEELSQLRPTGYTTVLKLMQIMAEKGLVDRDESSRAHIYSAHLGYDRALS
jgi:predicted transcriptional regulator